MINHSKVNQKIEKKYVILWKYTVKKIILKLLKIIE